MAISQKITDLAALTEAAAADVLAIVDDPAGGPATKKIIVSDFIESYKTTIAEIAAGVTPSNFLFESGDLRRYGTNTIPGTTDVTSAVTDWINVGLQGIALTHPGEIWLCSTWSIVSVATDLNITSLNKGVIKGTSSLTFLKPAGGEIAIEGVYFDLWNNVLENLDADSGTTPSLIVRWCRFTNITLYGIRHGRPIDYYDISHNSWETIITGCILIGDNIFAGQDTWQRGLISWNSAKDINNTGGGNVHFALCYGRHIKICNNYIENVTSNSGEAWGIFTKVRYAVVHSNTVNGISSTSSVTVAINIKGSKRTAPTTPQGYSHSCIGNTLVGSAKGTGIAVLNEDCLVSNNIIENFIDGITLTSSGDNVTVSNNNIIGANTSSGTDGIVANGQGDNLSIIGNNIDTVAIAIRIPDSGINNKNWIVHGNTFANCGGVAIEALRSADIMTGLSITNNVCNVATKFLVVGNVDGLTITGNRWQGLTGTLFQAVQLASPFSKNILIKNNSPFEVTTTDVTSTDVVSIDMNTDSAFIFEISVVAMESDGSNRALYRKGGLFFRDAGSMVQEGSTYDLATPIESDATWGGPSFRVASNGALARVIGLAATTIKWQIDVEVRSVN